MSQFSLIVSKFIGMFTIMSIFIDLHPMFAVEKAITTNTNHKLAAKSFRAVKLISYFAYMSQPKGSAEW